MNGFNPFAYDPSIFDGTQWEPGTAIPRRQPQPQFNPQQFGPAPLQPIGGPVEQQPEYRPTPRFDPGPTGRFIGTKGQVQRKAIVQAVRDFRKEHGGEV